MKKEKNFPTLLYYNFLNRDKYCKDEKRKTFEITGKTNRKGTRNHSYTVLTIFHDSHNFKTKHFGK